MIPALAFILSLVSPLVGYVGRGLVTAWIAFPIWLLISIFERAHFWRDIHHEVLTRKFELAMIIAWALVVYLNAIWNRGYTGDIHSMNVTTLSMIVFLEIAVTVRRDGSREAIMLLFVILLGIEVIRSLPTLLSTELIVRKSMYQGASSLTYRQASLDGVGEFGFYTGVAIAFPAIISFSFHQRGWLKGILLVLCFFIAVDVLLSTLMGAVLLMVLGFLLLGMITIWSWKSKSHYVIPMAIATTFGVLAWSSFFAESQQGEFFVDKLSRQSTSVTNYGILGGDLTKRTALWQQSYETFIENPLVGIGATTGRDNPSLPQLVGGHSAWLDMLAEYGIIGFGTYLCFVLAATRRAIRSIAFEHRNLFAYARIVSMVLYFVAGSYNPVAMGTHTNFYIFFFVLGGTVYMPGIAHQQVRVSNRFVSPVLFQTKRS
jgi:O-antigen ligase